MAYKKTELLEALNAFKKEHERYPTRKDFKAKRIIPGYKSYLRAFGSIINAIEQAELYEKGELNITEDELKIKTLKPVSKRGGFQCPFCGNYTQNASEYYSSLTTILSGRFIDLLKSNNGETYSEGVLDCIYAVFDGKNQIVRKELQKEGFLATFDKRHGFKGLNTKSSGIGKSNGNICDEYKDDCNMPINCKSTYRHEDISSDCLTMKEKSRKDDVRKHESEKSSE